MRISEQADRTGENITYSWLLEAPYRAAKALVGWRWVRGKPGCFVTNDHDLAASTAARFGLAVASNGSHTIHNAPLCLQ